MATWLCWHLANKSCTSILVNWEASIISSWVAELSSLHVGTCTSWGRNGFYLPVQPELLKACIKHWLITTESPIISNCCCSLVQQALYAPPFCLGESPPSALSLFGTDGCWTPNSFHILQSNWCFHVHIQLCICYKNSCYRSTLNSWLPY